MDGLFKSLSSGMGELVTAVEQRLPSDSVRLGSPATALSRREQGWAVTCGNDTIVADAVILACPAYVAARLLSRIDEEAAELCQAVPYVSTASISLAWPRAAVGHHLAGSGFVVARAHNALADHRLHVGVVEVGGARAGGHVLIRAFVGSAADPDAVGLGDDDLVEIAVRELGSVLGIAAPPALARVYRWPHAGAQHNVGQLARVARLEERLAGLPGLFVAGSGFRSVGIPDCVADGRAAAGSAAQHVRQAA